MAVVVSQELGCCNLQNRGRRKCPEMGEAVAEARHSFDHLLTALSPPSPGWAAPGHPVCHSWAARRGSQSLSTSYDSNVGAFNIVPEVSEVVLISFNSFFLFSSLFHIFLPFYLLSHLSYLLPLLFYCWFPPECF